MSEEWKGSRMAVKHIQSSLTHFPMHTRTQLVSGKEAQERSSAPQQCGFQHKFYMWEKERKIREPQQNIMMRRAYQGVGRNGSTQSNGLAELSYRWPPSILPGVWTCETTGIIMILWQVPHLHFESDHRITRACKKLEYLSRFKVIEAALLFTFPNCLKISLCNSVLRFLTYPSFSDIFWNDGAAHWLQQQAGFWVAHHQHVLTTHQGKADQEHHCWHL